MYRIVRTWALPLAIVLAISAVTACSDTDTPDNSGGTMDPAPRITKMTDNPCAQLLLKLHGLDVQLENLAAEMEKMGPDDHAKYDAAAADFASAQEQFKQWLGQYQQAECEPALGNEAIRTPPPRPEAAATSEPPLAYTCEMPLVDHRPAVASPTTNAGTRFSDGSPNCGCVQKVLDRLGELHQHYLQQQSQFGPDSARPNTILYGAAVGFDADVQTAWGMYNYFFTTNCS